MVVTAVSTNGEFQAAIDACGAGTPCKITVMADMAISSTLTITGKSLDISSAKTDGSNAELNGGGNVQLVNIQGDSTVVFSGIDFKQGYAVSKSNLQTVKRGWCLN